MIKKAKNKMQGFWLKHEEALIRHPWWVITIVLILTGIFAFSMVRNTRMDNDISRFLPDNDPVRIEFAKYSYIFGSGSGVAISITDKNSAFSRETVAIVNAITKRLEKVNNTILQDLLKSKVRLQGKDFEILFNLLLTEMGKQDFNYDNLRKMLTDRTVLAGKLGISLPSTGGAERGNGSADPDDQPVNTQENSTSRQNADPDDEPASNNARQSTPAPAQRNAPADADDSEQQEENVASIKNIDAIVNYFKSNRADIKKVYSDFTIVIDKQAKFKSKWLDDIISMTDNDHALIEFVDKTKFHKMFKDVATGDVDLLISYLLEKYINTKEKLKELISNPENLAAQTGISQESAQKIKALAKNFPYAQFFKTFTDPAHLQLRSDKLIRLRDGQRITPQDITLLRNRVKNWSFYNGAIISYDGKSTMILAKYMPEIVNDEMTRAFKYIEKIVQEETRGKNVKVHVAGEPVATYYTTIGMSQDITRLFPFVVLVVIIFLYLSFRHLKGVILPLITVLFSVIWTLGFMGFIRMPMNMISSTIPTILVAVGSAYGIHIISDYYLSVEKGEDKVVAVHKTLKKVGLAVFLAGLTTIVGFASNLFNSIVPIQEFGISTGLGVLFALIISMVFIPAWLRVGKLPKMHHKKERTKTHEGKAHKFLEAIGRSTYRKRWLYAVLMVVIFAAAIIGTFTVIVDMDNIKFFKEKTSLRQSDTFINQNFGGTSTLEIVFKVKEDFVAAKEKKYEEAQKKYQAALEAFNADNENAIKKKAVADAEKAMKAAEFEFQSYKSGIIRPEFLKVMESLQNHLAQGNYPGGEHIGKLVSIVDMLKKFNQTYNYGNPEKYVLTSDITVANFFITSFHGETTDNYITKTYRASRMIVQIKDSSTLTAKKIVDEAQKHLAKLMANGKMVGRDFANDAYEISFNGFTQVKTQVNNIIMDGQIQSIFVSLIAVFLIILIFYKTFAGAIVSIIPLSMTILVNFGFMGLFGIRLDAASALVASLAIGIGVDYTIHYINTFRMEAKGNSNIEAIIEHTTSHSGRAIIINAISVTAGFLVLAFSSFNSLMYMGILVALTMLVSSLASITIIPALLSIIKPKSLLNNKKDNNSQEVLGENHN